MANGVLALLKEIHHDKQSELEKDYYNRFEEIEKQLQQIEKTGELVFGH